jgi:hypothetical protein
MLPPSPDCHRYRPSFTKLEAIQAARDIHDKTKGGPVEALPPGALYFGCRHCHDLTYASCQEKSSVRSPVPAPGHRAPGHRCGRRRGLVGVVMPSGAGAAAGADTDARRGAAGDAEASSEGMAGAGLPHARSALFLVASEVNGRDRLRGLQPRVTVWRHGSSRSAGCK